MRALPLVRVAVLVRAVLLGVAVLPRVALPQETPAAGELGARVDALFERWDRTDAPGCAVAVVRAGAIVHAAGYGMAELEHGVPIGPDTIFHVASVTKQVTAMAVVLAAQDGALALDDELRRHVHEVPEFGAPLTLRHALHHTSGLRDQWEALAVAGWRLDDVITREHVLAFVSRQRALNFAPGTRWMYCNTGYTLAAEAVERATGRPFPDFARERIFAPLGMTRTHVHTDHRTLVPGRADSYEPDGDGFRACVLSYANAGATSLFTTAPDLGRWLVNLGTGTVGGSEGVATLLERARLADGREVENGYALGVMWGERGGVPHVQHAGGDAGFRSYVVWVPSHEVGVAVLANHARLPVDERALAVLDLLVPAATPPPAGAAGAEHADGTSAPGAADGDGASMDADGASASTDAGGASASMDAGADPLVVAEPPAAPWPVAELAGAWTTSCGFPVELTERRETLCARFGDQPRRRLAPAADGSWRMTVDDARLARDADGALVLRVAERDETSDDAARLGAKTWSVHPLARRSADSADADASAVEVAVEGEGEGEGEGERGAAEQSSPVGTYVCPELDALWRIEAEEDELVARHFRHGAVRLQRRWPDVLTGDRWFFARVELERAADGAVTGFRLQGARVRDLAFERR